MFLHFQGKTCWEIQQNPGKFSSGFTISELQKVFFFKSHKTRVVKWFQDQNCATLTLTKFNLDSLSLVNVACRDSTCVLESST